MDQETVKKMATLARISLSEAEIPVYVESLQKLLALEEKMLSIDTTGVEPLSHSLDIAQRLREDVVTETNERALLQSIAPRTMAGLYLVPKVID